MWLDCSRTWSFLVALSLATIADAGNYDNTRGGKGQREFICREEGYHADPQNCMIYYRCVLFGDGGPLTKYSFECGPGTVFSPLKGNVCTHPYESGRKECDGTNDDSNKINDIDSNNVHETGVVRPGTHGKPESQSPRPPPPPSTCPVCGPSSVAGATGTTAAVTPSSIRPSEGAASTAGGVSSTESIIQAPSKPNIGIKCTSDGFMADPYDCTKFYRCVDEGNGSYKRYDFTCGIGTIWDPKIDTCNHPWDVNRAGCNVPTGSNPSNEPHKGSVSTTTTVGVTPSSMKPGQGTSSTSGSLSNTENITQRPTPSPSGTVCTCQGFMGDPYNCKVFYRCLDAGNGKFTRQVFMCGIGTIWNPQISACDHPSKTNRPECNVPTDSGSSPKPPYLPSSSTTAGQTSSSIRPGQDNSNTGSSISTTESINPAPDGSSKPSQIPSSTSVTSGVTPTTVSPSREDSVTGGSISTTESINQVPNAPTSGPECTCAGFMADPKDCKKFYRCVDEGNGLYKRYEFGCGIGTAWDQELQTCNYPWAVNRDLCKIPTESNTSNKPSNPPGSTGTTAGVTVSSVRPTQGESSTLGSITTTESITQGPNEGSSGPPPLGSSPAVPPCEESSAVPPSGASSEIPPSESTSQVPPLEGSSEVPSTESSPNAPSSEISTNVPSSESSTQAPISDGSSNAPPSQVTSDAPSSGVPTSDGSSEVPPPQSSSETPSSQATSQTPSSEISSEVAPSGSSLSPGEGAPGVSPTTVPSTTDGSLAGPTAGDTQGSQCNEVEQNCGNQPVGGSDSTCMGEGFLANDNDCTKFYRCVSTGPGSYTKYEFACGSGTAWDQLLLTCNYIYQVNACKNSGNNKPSDGTTSGKPADITFSPDSSTESSSSSTSSSAESASSSSSSESTSSSSSSESSPSSSSESTSQQSSENTSTSKPCDKPAPPINNGIVCNMEGFYAHPNHCNKFYRCVDNGNGFNVYHFDCPPGTIFDPSISVCNHPSSVYPSRDCKVGENSGGTTGPSGTSEKPQSSTTETTVTPAKPEGESTEASIGSTPEGAVSSSSEATTGSSAEASTDTSQTSTSQEEQTSGSTTGISEDSSTEASQSTTSQEQSTTVETATEQSQSTTPVEQSSTEESASSTQDGTESSATTTSSAEETTNDMIQSTTSQEEQSSTIESGSSTESGTSDAPTSTNQPTTLAEQQSTESQEATTVAEQQSTDSVTQTTPSESEGSNDCMTDPSAKNCNKPPVAGTVTCPIGNLTGEQIVLVCPTGFKQHPKYCNMFYQCTMDTVMDVNILTFHCPDDTIFDDNKIQCLSEKKASQPCKGVKAGARVYRRVESSATTLINIEQRETLCPNEGYYPHNGQECSNVFYKCKENSSGALQGYLYECPENFVFWTVSRRCERASSLPMCSEKYSADKNDNDFWRSRWQLPVED